MPIEELHQVRDRLTVLYLVDRSDAGSGTELDIVVKTGTFVHTCDDTVTGQIGEDTAKHIQRLIYGPCGGVRSKVTRTVIHHLPRDRDFGEGVSPMDLYVWVALVILEADVVFRAMLLNEIHLKNERLKS